MCKAIEDMKNKERQETRIETTFNDIKKMMKNLNLTMEQAMAAIEISDSDRAVLVKRF